MATPSGKPTAVTTIDHHARTMMLTMMAANRDRITAFASLLTIVVAIPGSSAERIPATHRYQVFSLINAPSVEEVDRQMSVQGSVQERVDGAELKSTASSVAVASSFTESLRPLVSIT